MTLWEVFIRPRRGLSHSHVGSLHAPDAEVALRNARDVYTRRQEGVSIWVVPAGDITASSPDEKDAFFDPAADKVYRHPTFYDVPEGAGHMSDLFAYLLRLGDDALVLTQRLGEWSARAPEMEEDIALANIALDQLGAARMFLTYAGEVEGAGRDEDALAYLREDFEFRNAQIVELADNGDFAHMIVRLLCVAAYQHPLYDRLRTSTDERIAAIAAKAVKESAYHLDHASLWTVRLGGGTAESKRRVSAALDQIWPFTHELFESDETVRRLAAAGVAVDPATLRETWNASVDGVLRAAGLAAPLNSWRPTGGRQGRHTEALSYLLAEMQVVHRAYPGATW